VAFTADSLDRHGRAAAGDGPVIQDRTTFEVVNVFGRLLRDQEHLSHDDFEVLTKFLGCAERLRRQPDTLIYIHAPISVIMNRIEERGRPAEKHLTPKYLSQLETRYEDFLERWTSCPIVEVNSSSVDLRDSDQFATLAASLIES
jgi:deoxyadenosine/deoxycytidine kinase